MCTKVNSDLVKFSIICGCLLLNPVRKKKIHLLKQRWINTSIVFVNIFFSSSLLCKIKRISSQSAENWKSFEKFVCMRHTQHLVNKIVCISDGKKRCLLTDICKWFVFHYSMLVQWIIYWISKKEWMNCIHINRFVSVGWVENWWHYYSHGLNELNT